MPTRPQPLLAPRPNLHRVHPLDEYEQALVDDPIDEPPPDERDLLWFGLLICLATAGVTLYGIWQVVKWILA